MLQLPPGKEKLCPYRDCFGVETSDGRVTWYQLLAVDQFASDLEVRHRYEQRRALAEKNRLETRNPVWDVVLDELQRAFDCLRQPRLKSAYDAELARLSRIESAARSRNSADHSPDCDPHSDASEPPVGSAASAARGRFEPLRQLGRGEHGTRVYEAFELTLGRAVAVKCLEKPARTEARCRSFIAEARFLASISHPNIVEIHAVNDRNHWIVMELLSSRLNECLAADRSGKCSPEQVTRFLTQALSALQELHQRGVTHGHLSQDSFRGSESGTIKLADAPGCTREGQFRAPSRSQICVAPELLSPETFGEPRHAVDLYMLGFVAVQLLAGNELLKWFPKVTSGDAAAQEQWLRWHATPLESMPDLKAFVPGIPVELAETVERLGQKQVADRFQNAADALQHLRPLPASASRVPAADTPAPGAGASTAIEHRGGGAPCLVEAKADGPQAPDLVTTLLDHTLLWKALRTHRSLQLACSITALMLVIVLFAGGDNQTAVANAAPPSEEPPPAVPQRQHQPPPEPDSQWTDLPTQPPAVVAGARYQLEDLQPVPLLPEPPPMPMPTDEKPGADGPLQPPAARPFSVVGAPSAETDPLRMLLRQMQTARKSVQWQDLLNEARAIAPADPRPLFVFCAKHQFSRRTQEELREAVQLSPTDYTQPFRKSVESELRGPRDIADVTDEVIADLIYLREKLTPACEQPRMAYDWEWIGRVLGYIEARAQESAHCRRMLDEHRPRLLDGLDSDSAAGIQRGRKSIQQDGGPIDPAHLFPLTPDIDIGLCLATLQSADHPHDDDSSLSNTTIVADSAN